MSLLANSNAIEDAGYKIQRSLRFRSSASAYLSRTPASAGNRQTWTWSGWIKRGAMPGAYVYVFSDALNGSNNFGGIGFNGADQLDLISYTSTSDARIITTQVFRDPAAWYHIVAVFDTTNATSTDRLRLYVNGSRVTAFSTATYPAQNYQGWINYTYEHDLGRFNTGSNYFDGYLAEVNFIDGQALTPSSFGQTDAVTGVWTPKKYTGTYGTNGFYLPFSDNTSATTLAYDKSGNGNNWTPNNISTTAGATYDSMTDVPTLTSATAANYCVLNPLNKGSDITLTSGNLQYSSATAASYSTCLSTFGITSGQWYWEVTVGSSYHGIGLAKEGISLSSYPGNTNGWAYVFDGTKQSNGGAGVAYGASYTTNDIIGVAFDADAGTLTFYKNNTSQGTAYTGLTSGPYFPSLGDSSSSGTVSGNINFGQRPFSYTPPTGFKALNTFNLPEPTIKKPNQYMDATLYSGTSASQSVTNAGAFQPDLVWIKSRSAATDHKLTDSVRGVTKALISDTTGAETTDTNGLTAFNSNGFTVGSDSVYNNGTGPATYVGWQWKESATAGFDIVTYTGNGSNRTISHSLGVAPSMMIVKSRSQGTTGYTGNWAVWHSAIANTEYLLLNTTAAKATGATYWNSTTPTSSVFSLGTAAVVNNNNDNFVNYLFAEIAGFSKFGSYTGNGSADGVFVYTGFRPAYVMTKCSSTTGDWRIYDLSRPGYNVIGGTLLADTSGAETTTAEIDLLSNGFKFRIATDPNSAQTFVYAAFSQNPFKYSNAR